MDATAWATFWVFLGFVVFIAILIYMRIPAKLTAALDVRSAKIRSELEDAARLRREAEELLAQYQRRRSEAEAEAQAIVEQARHEAAAFTEEAQVRIAELVTRRTKAVEDRIAQAEAQAVAEVRSRAIDVAAAAAARILAEKAAGRTGDELVERSIQAVRSNLN